MKRKPILLSIALVALFGAILPRQAEADVSFSYFYDNLSPYGDWVEAGDYGYCWRPSGVDESWRPYTDGYWVFTDAGWTWVSYEDYGSITYHYGRWVSLEDYGWVWKPDYEWGPAWVSWRKSDDYVGWAPLPPEAHFSVSVGFGGWVDRDYDIGPSNYSFCEVRNFGAPVLRNVIVERRRNVTIINKTVNITNITINNKKKVVYNGGPDYTVISRRSDRAIATLKLQRRTEDRKGRPNRSTRVGNELVVDAPRIEQQSQRPAAPPKVARVFKQAKVDKGWGGVTDPASREHLREKIRSENKGREAAKPVDEQRLEAVLPPKADPKGTPGGFRRPDGEQGRGKERNKPAAQESQPGVQHPAQDRVAPKEERRSHEKEQKLQPFVPPTDTQNPARPKEENRAPAREEQNQAERTRKNEAPDSKARQQAQREAQRAQRQEAQRAQQENNQRRQQQQQQVERLRQQNEQNNRARQNEARQQERQRSPERNQDRERQQPRQSEVRQSRQAERQQQRQERRQNQQDDSGRKDKKKKGDN